jgi:hypothetical protein
MKRSRKPLVGQAGFLRAIGGPTLWCKTRLILRGAVFVFAEKLRLGQRVARAKWREFTFISISFCAAKKGNQELNGEESIKNPNDSIVKERTV